MTYHGLLAFELMASTLNEMTLFMDYLTDHGWEKQKSISCTWEKSVEAESLKEARAQILGDVLAAEEYSGKPLVKYSFQVGELAAVRNF